MGHGKDSAPASPLRLALQNFTKDRGYYREDLLEALDGELLELRNLWQIDTRWTGEADKANAQTRARNILVSHFGFHIANVKIPQRAPWKKYIHAVFAGFNLPHELIKDDLSKKDLTRRRAWLEQEAPVALRVSASTSQRYIRDAIAQIEQQILSASQQRADPAQEPLVDDGDNTQQLDPPSPAETIIRRPDYEQKIRDLAAPHGSRFSLVCIYGEAGTGKTMLASQVARQIAGQNGRVIELHPSNLDLLRTEIVEALSSEGLQPAEWTEPYCRAELRRRLNATGEVWQSHCVVIDDAQDEDLVRQLVPDCPTVPVILTMRSRPRRLTCSSLEISDFSEEQACEFLRSRLPGTGDTEQRSLAQAFGYRPLALEQATRFLREIPSVTPVSLIEAAATSVASGLELIDDSTDTAASLASLYRYMLEEISKSSAAYRVLDTFLAITGRSGLASRLLLTASMGSAQDDSNSNLILEAGLRQLKAHGLVREIRIESVIESEEHPIELAASYISMHPLTIEIFRELRLKAVHEVETAFLQNFYNDRFGVILELDELGWSTPSKLAILVFGMFILRSSLPSGWLYVRRIDGLTSVAVHQENDASGRVYLTRYESYPHATYALDYRTGARRVVNGEEQETLARLAKSYSAFWAARVLVSGKLTDNLSANQTGDLVKYINFVKNGESVSVTGGESSTLDGLFRDISEIVLALDQVTEPSASEPESSTHQTPQP